MATSNGEQPVPGAFETDEVERDFTRAGDDEADEEADSKEETGTAGYRAVEGNRPPNRFNFQYDTGRGQNRWPNAARESARV